jgi:hypothetical protein
MAAEQVVLPIPHFPASRTNLIPEKSEFSMADGLAAAESPGVSIRLDGLVKNPSAALRGNFVVAAHL